MSDKRTQRSGDNSTNIQAEIVQVGISYSEARTIAEDVYRQNALSLARDAADIAEARVSRLHDRFLEKLRTSKSEAPAELSSPDFQYALFEAQKAYAKVGGQESLEILTDLLVKRSSESGESTLQITLNESIQIVGRLNQQHIAAITLSFLLRHADFRATTFDDFVQRFGITFTLAKSAPRSQAAYSHLEYVGCATRQQLIAAQIATVLQNKYPGFFAKGFPKEAVSSMFPALPPDTSLLVPCFHDREKVQVAAVNQDALNRRCVELGVDEPTRQSLRSKLKEVLTNEEALAVLVKANADAAQLSEVLQKTSILSMQLTSVGLVIANARLRSLLGHELDLSATFNE